MAPSWTGGVLHESGVVDHPKRAMLDEESGGFSFPYFLRAIAERRKLLEPNSERDARPHT